MTYFGDFEDKKLASQGLERPILTSTCSECLRHIREEILTRYDAKSGEIRYEHKFYTFLKI